MLSEPTPQPVHAGSPFHQSQKLMRCEVVNRYREAPSRVADRVFLSCGRYESLIWDNRALQPHLARSGMRVNYVESRDGHNWENWRDRLREGLSWLFPGPLGLVYE